MPNIKSAKKRVVVNAKKNLENRIARSQMNTAIKKFNNALDTNNLAEAEALLPSTISVIDSTASKGVIHKNNAANKKSALSKRLHDVKSGKLVIDVKKDNKTIAAEKAKIAGEAREAAKAEYAKKTAEKQAQKIELAKAKLELEKKAGKGAKKDTKKAPKEEAKAEVKEVKSKKAPKADAEEAPVKEKKAKKAKDAE